MLKTVVLTNIFVETDLFFRIHRWIESSKEQHFFKIEIFCYIINVFTVTFDQFNASLINKSINFFLLTPKLTLVYKCLHFYIYKHK